MPKSQNIIGTAHRTERNRKIGVGIGATLGALWLLIRLAVMIGAPLLAAWVLSLALGLAFWPTVGIVGVALFVIAAGVRLGQRKTK